MWNEKILFLQEYEAMTRGLIRGNPSVPVQGTAEELKQVLLTCDLLIVWVQFFFLHFYSLFSYLFYLTDSYNLVGSLFHKHGLMWHVFFIIFLLFIYSLCHIYLFICYKNFFLFFLVAFFISSYKSGRSILPGKKAIH